MSTDNIELHDIDSHRGILFTGSMGLATKDCNNIKLDNNKFDKHDSTIVVLVGIIAWCNND